MVERLVPPRTGQQSCGARAASRGRHRRGRCVLHDLREHLLGLDAAQLAVNVHDEAVPDDGQVERLDVVGQHERAAGEQAQRLGRAVERDSRARAGAELMSAWSRVAG